MIHSQGRLKHFGSGCYASVYGSKKSNIVYKVGLVEKNDGYMAYLKVLQKQRVQNPYLPKIHGVRIYTNGRDSYYVAALEKLKELPYNMYSIVDAFEEACKDWMCDESISAGRKKLGIKTVVIYPKYLKEALDVIRTAKKSSRNIGYDLHDGNFMMRGKQVVITDPLA